MISQQKPSKQKPIKSRAKTRARTPERAPIEAPDFSTADHKWMGRALALAQRGRGTTRPNPIVGAVLVRNGRLLAEGYHQRAGLPHAEREALAAIQSAIHPGGGWAGGDPPRGIARGATLYVTLEPCCHTGRTPPCTDALIASGIERVVVGLQDPNPVVNGQGIDRLRRAGIRVDVGCRRAEAQAQNRSFLTWVEHGRPWVTLKVAATLDGFIADWSMPTTRETAPGPIWLTGEEARRAAHVLRAEHDAILVGAGTVLADDPLLTVRLPDPGSPVPAAGSPKSRPARGKAGARGNVATPAMRAPRSRAAASASGVVPGNMPEKARLPLRQPLRVVLDGRLRISPTARLLGSASASAQTLVFSSSMAPRQKANALEAAGAEVIRMPGKGSRVHLTEVLQELATRGIQSVLVEGGADVHAAFISAGLVDGVAVFQAPLLLGGGVPIARGQGRGVAAALRLGPLEVQRFGDDLCVRADVLR
jgi:diaminohydroxyphosphoribosylaminopyrimidine deaminase/5-amino-6-(5-phosphoribosylamino)uracil reductase